MDKESLYKVVKNAQKGDRSAWHELYVDGAKSVYYIALKILKNPDDAEDIVQDIFIAVFEKIGGLKTPEAYYKWLNRITATKCMDFLRKNNRFSSDENVDELIENQPSETAIIPEEYVDNSETRRIIMEIIDSLPDNQRVCVLYRYFSLLSVEEIAEITDANVHTVRSRLALARKKIEAAILEKEDEDEIRLHAIPLMPILLKEFERFSLPSGVSDTIWQGISKGAIKGAGTAGAAAKGGISAAKSAVKMKIAAAAGAVVVAGGGVAAAIIFSNQSASVPAGNRTGLTSQNAFITDENGNAVQTSELTNDEKHLENSPFKIEFEGENRAIFTFEHEFTEQLLADEEISLNVSFYETSENQKSKLIFQADKNWWIFMPEVEEVGDASNNFVDGLNGADLVDGNKIQWIVNFQNISEEINSCKYIRIYYNDPNVQPSEENNWCELYNGGFSSLSTENAAAADLEIMYRRGNIGIFKLFNHTALEHFYKEDWGEIQLKFYFEGDEKSLPKYTLRLNQNTNDGQPYLNLGFYENSYTRESENRISIDSKPLEIAHDSELLETENGLSALIKFDGIDGLLAACKHVEIASDDEQLFAVIPYENMAKTAKPQIEKLPDIFPKSSKDDEFFTPDSDDYVVVMEEYPVLKYYDYGFGYANGVEVYGPVDTHDGSVTVVSIISYDEFGLISTKTKMIYSNLRDAMVAPAGRLSWMGTEDLTDETEHDEQIMADFFEEMDREFYGSGEYTNHEYHGHFDNVRYFSGGEKMRQIRPTLMILNNFNIYDELIFGADGFYHNSITYEYDFSDFAYSISRILEDTATITAYASIPENKHEN